MAQIILDFGSATTCKNDKAYVKRMIDELKAVDSGKHDIVIKWQLFSNEISSLPDGTVLDPPVTPLNKGLFAWAYTYAAELGYETTASVFDKESLDYLLTFDIPFVKIANRPDTRWLIGEVPRKIPVYSSGDMQYYSNHKWENGDIPLKCITQYPATVAQYEKGFGASLFTGRISDHTIGFELWYKYKPVTIEWHYKLEDSTGYDAGSFARTPSQLKEVLG